MKKFLFPLLFLFVATTAYGNGDPTDRISALTASANPSPLKIADVQLISERLWIRPGDRTEVRVRYLLLNNSDKDFVDIDYGFPVDYQGGEAVNAPLVSDFISESSFASGWYDDYVGGVGFWADGLPLPFTPSKESTVSRPPKPVESEFTDDIEYWQALQEYEYGGTYRRWFYTRFSIKAGQSLTLEVCYTVRNEQIRRSSFYTPVLDKSENSYWFTYDLSPAAHWGDGQVRDLAVEIDTRDIRLDYPQQEQDQGRETNGVWGMPFSRQGDVLRYQARNFRGCLNFH